METLVIGAGAIGSIFGGLLMAGGHSVTFYDVDQDKVDVLNREGLTITEADGGENHFKVSAVSLIEDAPPPELGLILVKSHSTSQAARELSLVKKADTLVMSLQNGLGHVSKLAHYLDEKKIFPGITYQAAFEISPGRVRHSGFGLTTIAPLVKSSLSLALDLARLLNDCNIPAAASTDVKPLRWEKLIVNSAINPLSAIHKLHNGELPKNPQIVQDMMGLVMEGVAVAQKEGVPLNYGEMWATVLDACRATAHNRSSMLVDVENGRMTEIEAINGSIVRLGDRHGVDTPLNARMVRSVVSIHGKKDRIRVDL
ncbi:MAG: 2-dehydropantoate 2-reductase [Clostridiales bacterium]|nr:2-dehydropantoate 2-reductase [Clostridiales bacterium]